MNAISKLIGIISLIIMVLGLVPLLGWLNWLVLPLAGIGLIFGVFDEKKEGFKINAVVIIISLIRLALGGGII
jgi:hypothetical protein